MAYVLTGHEKEGPFPNNAGEFCGNYHPAARPDEATVSRSERAVERRALSRRILRQFPRIQVLNPAATFDPARQRLGLPHATGRHSVQELYNAGWRGKYLINDDNPNRLITSTSPRGILDGHIITVVPGPNGHWVAANPDDSVRCPWIKDLAKTPADLAEPDVSLI